MKETKQKTRGTADMRELFENKGFHRILKGYISYMVPHRSDVSSKLNIGGGSYTDGKRVVVGIDDWAFNLTDAEVLLVIQALAIHECQHVNSSSFSLYKKLIEDWMKHFESIHPEIPKNVAAMMAKFVGNGTEDGRIEWISVNKRPGTKKPLMFMRGYWWNTQPVQGDPLNDFLFAFVTYATMGIMPKNWSKHYDASHPHHDQMEKVKPLLLKATRAVNSHAHYVACVDILHCVEPYIVALYEEQVEKGNSVLPDMEMDFHETDGNSEQGEDSFTESTHFSREEKKQGDSGSEESKEASGNTKEESEEGASSDGNEHSKNEGEQEENQATSGGSSASGEESVKEIDAEEGSSSRPEGRNQDKTDDELVEEIVKEASKAAEATERQLEQEEKRKAREEELNGEGLLDELSPAEIEKIKHESDLMVTEIVTQRPNMLQKNPVKLPAHLKRQGRKLRNEIEEIFENKKAYTQRHLKKGVVDASSLWKIGAKETDIFMKKGASRETDFVAYLLCDASGSMRGDKYTDSGESVAIVEESLKGIIPFKIMQFTTVGGSRDKMLHLVLKDFSEMNSGSYTHSHYVNVKEKYGNADGVSIRVAVKELMNRPEKEKVLFVFSDGLPAEYSSFKAGIEDTRAAVREAQKNGIFVVSIYFENNKSERARNQEIFKHMYGQNSISCETDQITRHVSRTLKKILKNK